MCFFTFVVQNAISLIYGVLWTLKILKGDLDVIFYLNLCDILMLTFNSASKRGFPTSIDKTKVSVVLVIMCAMFNAIEYSDTCSNASFILPSFSASPINPSKTVKNSLQISLFLFHSNQPSTNNKNPSLCSFFCSISNE